MHGATEDEAARLAAAREDFLRRYPAYAATAHIDEIRAADYGRLDALGHTYLDYTGGSLYGESQIARHHELLNSGVFGNPHSENPTSLASTRWVSATRDAVRDFFRADPREYDVVFTANASGALKLVGESYPFGDDGRFLLSYDNHNSVNGIRTFAARAGSTVEYVPVRREDLRFDDDRLFEALGRATSGDRLFAFPAQSNFSGVQHPLEWVERAQGLGWDVVLDCAAFAPTNRLDLSAVKPDFVPISFYKIFGYPTGTGALMARREALRKLRRPWFAGGTISFASVQDTAWYRLVPGAVGFEDGTLDYLGLPAVEIGLEHIARIGIESIHARVTALCGWVLEEAMRLRHSDGAPLVRVFGPSDTRGRGATVAFHLLDPQGLPYDVDEVELAAGRELISLRSGCFCNPGDGEIAHGLSRDDMATCFGRPEGEDVSLRSCQLVLQGTDGSMPNTLRASFGVVSDFGDAYRFLRFCAGYRDRPRGAPTRA